MSAKVKDEHNRWRNKIVAFRMSPEEAEKLDRFVKISGLQKQEYLIRRVLQKEITVEGPVPEMEEEIAAVHRWFWKR